MDSSFMDAKDSLLSLKAKSCKVNHHVYSLNTESTELLENLEQRQHKVEELEKTCKKLEVNLGYITEKLGAINEKRESLNNLRYEILKDMSTFQGFLQSAESRSETTLLRDLNQNLLSLCSSIKELQHSLESAGCRAVEKEEMTALMHAIEEIRNSVAQICATFQTTSIVLNDVQRTVSHMSTRIESFICQGSSALEQLEEQQVTSSEN
ncbi:testis-specific serine kinase substrate [Eleutherodactylus coqui]|uniref:testis-specific serine kinase substrate n=1 Tax=Eleutherodactylus coqui TaxID=57060 RepID=UPI003462A84C